MKYIGSNKLCNDLTYFGGVMMTRKEVERIVGIFKNHGIDKETGKRVKENVIHDFFDEIDDLMGYEGASEVIFVPEEYGLDKEATIQEIVDYILENQNIG